MSTRSSARSRRSPIPVHVVATTGGIVAPNEVATPQNAIVLNYAAHDPIMRRAALVVTHGGHGTAMRALRHGVPMVVIPGLAGDQPFVAAAGRNSARVSRCGATPSRRVRAAAIAVLDNPAYRAEARRRAEALTECGSARAAQAVESLLRDGGSLAAE